MSINNDKAANKLNEAYWMKTNPFLLIIRVTFQRPESFPF